MTSSGAAGFTRHQALARMGEEHFDVVVIGGGITGAGVALDAAARGLRVALVERHDFASGTSSQSSKLIHGGLRYLGQRQYRLVAQALAERQRLLANAPHLVRPLPFVLPLYGHGRRVAAEALATDGALWLYDLAGGLRIGRHRRLSTSETVAMAPGLRSQGLRGGFAFYDAQADDARLTLAVIRTAVVDHGATAVNHAAVTALTRDASGQVRGVRIRVGRDGDGADQEIDVAASVVVNATGVWSAEVAALDDPASSPRLRPARGVHLMVSSARIAGHSALVLPAGGGRSIFVVPWPEGDRVYIGTTDTDHPGPLDEAHCRSDDVTYLLDAVNRVVAEPLSTRDVVGTWAGLRPLVDCGAGLDSASADLSRRHLITRSPGGLISVTGGKLTTYRLMAAATVDAVLMAMGRGGPPCPTARLAIRGARGLDRVDGPAMASRLGVDDATLTHLSSRYGCEARTLVAMIRARPELRRTLVATLPYLAVEAVYAARYEMAFTLDDVLVRRTRSLILARRESVAAAADVAALVGAELGWSREREAAEVANFVATAELQRSQAGLDR